MTSQVRLVDLSPKLAWEEGRRNAILCHLGGFGLHKMVYVRTFNPDGSLTKAAVAFLVGTWVIRRAP
jgi:hypothetical protein